MKKKLKKLTLSRETLRTLRGGTVEISAGEPKSRWCPVYRPVTDTSCTVDGSGLGCCSFPVGCGG